MPEKMPEKRGIYWLSSYPKSGNTWFRIFLAHVLDKSGRALDLNKIKTGAIASARTWVDEALGFDSADLSYDEVDALRPAVYAWHAQQKSAIGYHKTHDAYTYLADGRSLLSIDGVLGAIYFIRNPLDVVISLANHMNCSIDKAIEVMGKANYTLCSSVERQHYQLRQILGSWSFHVQSWCEEKTIKLLVLRYEDMKHNPIETFTKAVDFLNLDVSATRIAKALDDSDIKRLQRLEQASGFKEKPAQAKSFFRKGIVGDWKNILISSQIDNMIEDHGAMMALHGYLNND